MFKRFTNQSWPIIGKPIIIKIKSIYNGMQIYSYMPYMYWQERHVGWSEYNDDPGDFFFTNMLYDTEETILQAQEVVDTENYQWCYYGSHKWIKFDMNDKNTYPVMEKDSYIANNIE